MLNTDRSNSPPTAKPSRTPQVRPAPQARPAAEPAPLHPAFPSQRYGLIYADPPWHYDGDPNQDQAAGKHYPLMRNPDIAALPVGSITAPQAALFSWACAGERRRGRPHSRPAGRSSERSRPRQ